MARTDDLVIFARVAEHGSFSRVAEQLGIAKSIVSKQVSRLEQTLGARLLHRTTRHLSLTEAGLQVLPHAQRILDELGGIDDAVSGLQSHASGTLRVSAPVAVGNKYVSSVAPAFLKQYPDVKLVMSLNDRHVDIVSEGFDLSIRLTSQPPENWQARKLKQIRYHICATPTYLEAAGVPKTPEDLSSHCCLMAQDSSHARWRLQSNDGAWHEQQVSGSLVINTSEGLRAAVIQHAGIALLPEYAIDNDLADGRLVTLLDEYAVEGPFGETLYALYLPNRYLAPKTRAFIDYLVEALA